MINDLLFVYGSLLNTDNEFGNYLRRNSALYSTGKFKGKMYDVGEYPGAITGSENDYNITGTIYKLTNPVAALQILDDYEGFGHDQDQPNLFVRELLAVDTGNGFTDCWVYLYNLPVDGLKEIASGDYMNYLNQDN